MSFDAPPQHRLRIAIVGGGISGLAAAYRLTPQHDVTLYETAPSLGGHARTVVAGRNGDQPVDTGFIVFNFVNYPYLTAMFRDLDVPVEKSNMSFGATIDDGRVEYGLGSLGALFAQKSNARRPGFLAMVRDIMRFNARAEGAVNDGLTIEELMRELRLGDWFRRYYLMPICGAIWSTPMEQIGSFPAATLVRFFRNHALMNVTGQHQWWTVKGGSREYVRRLETRLSSLGCDLRTGAPVQAVERDGQGVVIRSARFGAESFDQVILACHSDEIGRAHV